MTIRLQEICAQSARGNENLALNFSGGTQITIAIPENADLGTLGHVLAHACRQIYDAAIIEAKYGRVPNALHL